MSAMASLEKSLNSLQTGVGVEALFMLRCDRSPVMLTWLQQLTFRLAHHSCITIKALRVGAAAACRHLSGKAPSAVVATEPVRFNRIFVHQWQDLALHHTLKPTLSNHLVCEGP